MIDKNELLFVVDENNQPLDPLPRYVVHEKNLWHRSAAIWIISRNKTILCQKRSLKKDIKPGMWEAYFGGHVGAHESYLQTAKIELEEELGITATEKELIPYKLIKSDSPKHRKFQQVYGLVLPNDRGDFLFEPDEIDQLAWKSIDELRRIFFEKNDTHWTYKPWDKDILDWLHTLATSDFIA